MHHDASDVDLILQRRKLIPNDANCLTQGHRAEEWLNLDLNLGIWLQSSCGHILHGVLPGTSVYSVGFVLFVCVPSDTTTFSLFIHSVLY